MKTFPATPEGDKTPMTALLPFNISQAINSFENAAFACGMAHSNDEWDSAKAGLDAERRTLNGYIAEMGASLERRISALEGEGELMLEMFKDLHTAWDSGDVGEFQIVFAKSNQFQTPPPR